MFRKHLHPSLGKGCGGSRKSFCYSAAVLCGCREVLDSNNALHIRFPPLVKQVLI